MAENIPKHRVNLKKASLLDLNNMLFRQNALLQEKRLTKQLPDKGQSVIHFRDAIQSELDHRKELTEVEKSFGQLSHSNESGADVHMQKLFEMERNEFARYKPNSTLNKHKDPRINSNVGKLIEDAGIHSNKPTKLLHLDQSITLLAKQDDRVKNEQMRVKLEKETEWRVKDDDDSMDSDSNHTGIGASDSDA